MMTVWKVVRVRARAVRGGGVRLCRVTLSHIRRRDAERMRQSVLAQPDRALWTELDVLEGPRDILYAWAMTLPVRAVRITDGMNDPAIAVDTKPYILHIASDVGGIVSARHNPNLRELTVGVAVGNFVSASVLRSYTVGFFV